MRTRHGKRINATILGLLLIVWGAFLVTPTVLADAPLVQCITPLAPLEITTDTEEKPQSKVWRHDGNWWAVVPSAKVTFTGSWIWRLEPDHSWLNILFLSGSTPARADVKVVGDVVHILLYEDQSRSAVLWSAEYIAETNTYERWADRPSGTSITLPGSDTAMIDIDSEGRMWLATHTKTTIDVYYSDPPYTSFSGPIELADGVKNDDLSLVVALPNDTVGVLWSNQNTQRFGFRVHQDGQPATTWSADEEPASQSAQLVGSGMADDHLNAAVASDGTLYAAVKTSYDTVGFPKIALLVRRLNGVGPSGTWDDLYEVDQVGTRPIAVVNEVADLLRVLYTKKDGFGDIVYKDSALSTIALGARDTLIEGSVRDATSTKRIWSDELVVLAADNGGSMEGRLISLNPPTISIDDVTATEGDAGEVEVVFTVSLSGACNQTTEVSYETADGTAIAPDDYVTGFGTLTFPPQTTTRTITLAIEGDTLAEADETFFVNLVDPVDATIADAQGQATILNDDDMPSLSIDDVSVLEGDAGTVDAVFTVSLSAPSSESVEVDFAVADGTATAGNDYTVASGTLTFPPMTTTQTISVEIVGDLLDEIDEGFFVNLDNPLNAPIADAQGEGTILDDDDPPSLSIDDVSVLEGDAGTVDAVFTVSLSAPSSLSVEVSFASTDGTALAGSDYTAVADTLTFPPGTTVQTLTVEILGDALLEPSETYLIDLTSPINATISDGQGEGTIVDDELVFSDGFESGDVVLWSHSSGT